MLRRPRHARQAKGGAERRRRGRSLPHEAGPERALSAESPTERRWSLDELGAAILELGLYPEAGSGSFVPEQV